MMKILLIFLFIAATTAQAQTPKYLHRSGKDIADSTGNPILLRGIGLGGWLVPEGYMLQFPGFGSPTVIREMITDLIGEANTEQFYQVYEANYVNAADIDLIAEWGYNSIRLPFHYKNFWDEQTSTFREEGFALVDSMISWCKKNDLYLILDMHAAPGGQSSGPIADGDGVLARLWTEPTNKLLARRIWKEIASRYADNKTIGGYDLLNEPVMPSGYSNTDLRAFYNDLARDIRLVDNNHILLIEGNWYATNFDQLTPLFDNNMAYSFHKYWSETTINTIRYLLDIRDNYNVPLWMGESGENSNVWYYQAVKLFEDNNIGWCWWTNKKFGTITSPLSAPITQDYQTLLDYWNGQGTQPTQEFATNALINQANQLAIENCEFRPGVIASQLDPEFATVNKPYKEHTIPGVINAVDYDIGTHGVAYWDTDNMNIGGSSWNTGYQYRNDGVDIQISDDPQGFEYHVAWINDNEYLIFTVNVEIPGTYRVDFRLASGNDQGRILLYLDNTVIGSELAVANSGGYSNWSTQSIDDVVLPSGTHKLAVYFPTSAYNLNRMNFELIEPDTVTGHEPGVISSPVLKQNYPNPFNPETTIVFYLPADMKAELNLFSLNGELVKQLLNGVGTKGRNVVTFNAGDLASGVYLYQLKSGGTTVSRKMTFLR